jgi:CDP-6-deoxy-D-xylo-4-hexulose-3-dehydrase
MGLSMFNWPLMVDRVSIDQRKELADWLLSADRLTCGPQVERFERDWSAWLGVAGCSMVTSGSAGNFLSIALLKYLRGCGEVIVPALGWSSDVASLIQLGFVPVFVDVNLSNLSLSEVELKKAITDKTVAVVVVHGLGFNGLSDSILQICRDNDLFLIEDCCEAHGARFGDSKVGCFGDLSIFSFYYGHHMTTVEGGMVCYNDLEFDDLSKMFRAHGMTRIASSSTQNAYRVRYPDLNPLFTFAVPGFNFRPIEINGLLGQLQLKDLDEAVTLRTRNLYAWLESLDASIFFTKFEGKGSSNFALPLILNKPDEAMFLQIKNLLEKEGVEYRVGTAGGGNLAEQPFVLDSRHTVRSSLSVVKHIHKFGLYIGNHEAVEIDKVQLLASKINALRNGGV